MNFIDPHLHFFDLSLGQYRWLKPDNPPFWPNKQKIQANFNEQDLVLVNGFNCQGFVHIEAGFDNQAPQNEISWLEKTVQGSFKSIACIDLTAPLPAFESQLALLKAHSSVMGVRHILDDEATRIFALPDIQEKFELLASNQFLFECQMLVTDEAATQKLNTLLSACPSLQVIVNHFGSLSLPATTTAFDKWQQAIRTLANHSQLAIKCSGWEMAFGFSFPSVSEQLVQQQYIVNECFNCFGAERVMIGSNFPVLLLLQSYADYWQQISRLNLPSATLENLVLNNAKLWYQFP